MLKSGLLAASFGKTGQYASEADFLANISVNFGFLLLITIQG